MEDIRPKWTHKLPEGQVAWLASGVTKITHHWEMTGVDTSRDWIELHKANSEKRVFDSAFLNTNGYFVFRPNWRELVVATHDGERALKDLAAIAAWERKHAAERAEFERLRKKFGDVT